MKPQTSISSNDLFSHPISSAEAGKEDLSLKVKVLREENAKLQASTQQAIAEKDRLESFLVEVKIKSANLDLEND